MPHFAPVLRLALLAWAILTALGLSSCTLAPARLKRVMAGDSVATAGKLSGSGVAWKDYFDRIDTAPDSAEGHQALLAVLMEGRKRLAGTPGLRQTTLTPELQLEFSPGGLTTYAHDYFEELIPASSVRVTRLRHHRREGTGLPMIGRRENKGRGPMEAHYPPEAITRPVTVVGKVHPARQGSRRLVITLYSSLGQDTVMVHGRRQPLAADMTASWVALLERTGPLRSAGLGGFLGRRTDRQPQLYLMESYDPRRAPLILVHGLLSTPLTWASVTNDLWGDPDIRRRYQIWHYHYPTSSPFLYSASVFRRQLGETLQILRKQGHPEVQPVTIIAHSMGGLISKTLITDSGDQIWETVMAVPHARLKGSAEDLAAVYQLLHWRASQKVKRVVFVSVPHRGSPVSLGPAGRLGTSLSGVPDELTGLWRRVIRDNPGATTDAFKDTIGRGRLTSIQTLSPNHPVLPVLNSLPVAPWVTTHSIIGNRGRPGPLEDSSDGVVPYASSHWPVAVSEKIVPSGHSAARHPATVEELKRLLRLP